MVIDSHYLSTAQVTVDWEAVPLTAQSSDFIPSSGVVVLDNGVSSIQLPLSIIDDTEPEFSETLSVSLVGSGGGARLGAVLTATVTILASDDPNGALRKNYNILVHVLRLICQVVALKNAFHACQLSTPLL